MNDPRDDPLVRQRMEPFTELETKKKPPEPATGETKYIYFDGYMLSPYKSNDQSPSLSLFEMWGKLRIVHNNCNAAL